MLSNVYVSFKNSDAFDDFILDAGAYDNDISVQMFEELRKTLDLTDFHFIYFLR